MRNDSKISGLTRDQEIDIRSHVFDSIINIMETMRNNSIARRPSKHFRFDFFRILFKGIISNEIRVHNSCS